ncbi:EthD domain-containing protein [Halopseudomonas maritima]|uniref:EthD domain-containing protein n=1 Tax=Halopseudomonas maritima TaxID=2918528 RepID=UPI001EEB1FF6|nr:EthD domain-containing protein [Halopseudomonas maritima]UJJ31606.1 EthD domain-containing protein [Halopseudomonas maritima]
MKAISLLSRRLDLSKDAFRSYYEDNHSPLAMRHFPYRRYTRNHLVEDVQGLDFDCISESQMMPGFDTREMMHSRSRQLMVEDERRFMRPEKIRVALAQEFLLLDAEEHAQTGYQRRHALLLSRAGLRRDEFRQRAERWAQALHRDVCELRQISLDLLTPVAGSDFPFDGVLWLSMPEQTRPLLALPGMVIASIAVHTHASSVQELQRNFVAYLP